MRGRLMVLAAVVVQVGFATVAAGQSGIRWSGSASEAVSRAKEQGVPVMFWVTERTEWDDDGADDLKDAQEDAFRDPVVRALIERYFVPCRVARNSRTMAEAERLGLPSQFGLYIAIVTPEGEVLDRIDPFQVAMPEALADRLAAASRVYRESVYVSTLRPVLTNPGAKKADVRRAVRRVWQMRIIGADQDVEGLLSRRDLTAEERSRLYGLLAAFGTAPSVGALLDAAPTDAAAMAALMRAEPAALPTLLESMPVDEGGAGGEWGATPRQLAAYRAAASVAKVGGGAKGDAWWAKATAAERRKELERVRSAAEAVYGAWEEREGRWR